MKTVAWCCDGTLPFAALTRVPEVSGAPPPIYHLPFTIFHRRLPPPPARRRPLRRLHRSLFRFHDRAAGERDVALRRHDLPPAAHRHDPVIRNPEPPAAEQLVIPR